VAGLQNFQNWCVSKFGSLMKLWRCLDLNNNMRIGQLQFLKGLRELGHPGDSREVFKLLNKDGNNTLLFYHFAPEAALAVAKMLRWARVHHGGLEEMCFMSSFENCNWISSRTFFHLFRQKGFIDEEALICAYELLDKNDSGTINRVEAEALDRWDTPEWLIAEPNHDIATSFKVKLLEKHDGNATLAWRNLDSAEVQTISWHTFRQACRKLVSAEDLQNLPCVWRTLDTDLSGYLSFGEFDPDSFDIVSRFCSWALKQHCSVFKAFPRLHKHQKLEFDDFCDVCRPSGLSDHNIHHLFTGLAGNESGAVGMNEIRFLEKFPLSASMKQDRPLACQRHLTA